MKPILLFVVLLLTAICYSQDTASVTINSVSHSIYKGQSASLGYGSNPYGSFMYILNNDGSSLEQKYARQDITIGKVKLFKRLGYYRIHIKGRFGWAHFDVQTTGVCPAIEKKEVLGVEGVLFFEN